eukprot:2111396-Prymnesium_polylepis.2
MVRSAEARAPSEVARLARKIELDPAMSVGRDRNDRLVACLANAAKRAICRAQFGGIRSPQPVDGRGIHATSHRHSNC